MDKPKRFLSVDCLKALGIIYLLLLHQFMWIFIEGDVGHLRFNESYSFFVKIAYNTGLHVLGFGIPLLAGITFNLKYANRETSFQTVLRRCFFLASIGFLMNFLTWGSEDVFAWDVLQFISISIALSFIIFKLLPRSIALGLLIGLAILSVVFSDRFLFPSYQSHYWYKIIIGDIWGENYWPLIPWFSVFVAGVITGEFLKNNDQKKLTILFYGALFLAVISLASKKFLPTVDVEHVWGSSLFKPFYPLILGVIGFDVIAIVVLENLFTRFQSLTKFISQSWVNDYAQGILWIYVISIIIGFKVTNLLLENHLLDSYSQALKALPILWTFQLILGIAVGRLTHLLKHKLKSKQ